MAVKHKRACEKDRAMIAMMRSAPEQPNNSRRDNNCRS